MNIKREIFSFRDREKLEGSSGRNGTSCFIRFFSIFLVFLMVISTINIITHTNSSKIISNSLSPKITGTTDGLFHVSGNFENIPFFPASVYSSAGAQYNKTIAVLVSFSLNNQPQLQNLLSGLQDQKSTNYHNYITRSQFTQDFSVSSDIYKQAGIYFHSFAGISVKNYSDRVSMRITGPASQIGKALNTTFSAINGIYHANSAPELPSTLANYVSFISGLSNSVKLKSAIMGGAFSSIPSHYSSTVHGYPEPVNNGSHQEIFGTDMQVAYEEQSLFNVTYANREVIANILWSGHDSSGMGVGAFYPYDISTYFNATVPSFEPRPLVYGVPIQGAPAPGASAAGDITGANLANTASLEMIGSMAPGASVYDVYGPNATFESVYAALASVLNPNPSDSPLNNVSVINNPWLGQQYNSSMWYSYMEEAAARGITVISGSGNSGDNTSGSSTLDSPGSMAYDNFGVTAVGGTEVSLRGDLMLYHQQPWYMHYKNQVAGSTGGISSIYPEPAWQSSSYANNVIGGKGRGVPDISALANNTAIFWTDDGINHDSMNNYYNVRGTGIASSLVAGIIGESDAVLHHYNQNNAGYLNPFIYSIAEKQFKPYPKNTFSYGFEPSGNYLFSTGMAAFSDVAGGGNGLYRAVYPYNLVTGWGSINAYNFTSFMLHTNYSADSYAAKGVIDNLVLNGLRVTSYKINYTDMKNENVNTVLNASIQQNLFLSNQLNAPVYWIQNVIDFKALSNSDWTVYYSEWVMFPFYGQYYHETFQYNYHYLQRNGPVPHNYDMKTWLAGSGHGDNQVMYFQFDNLPTLSLPVPGAAYIITQHNYTYSWNGQTYYNGPYPDNSLLGGLDPQLGLVGGPTLSNGEFESPTSGTMNVSYEPMYSNHYITPITTTFHNSTDQTGERASNLLWSQASQGHWTLGIKQNSGLQGVEIYSPQGYNVTFHENGLPTGKHWFVNLSGGASFESDSNSISFTLPNGTYTVNVTAPGYYVAHPFHYSFNVTGNVTVSKAVVFNYTPPQSILSPFLHNKLYLLAGGVILIAIAATVFGVRRRKT